MALDIHNKYSKVTNLNDEFEKFKNKNIKPIDNIYAGENNFTKNHKKSNDKQLCFNNKYYNPSLEKCEIFKNVDFSNFDNENRGEIFTSGLVVKKISDLKLIIASKILDVCDYIQNKYKGCEFSILCKGDWDENGNWVITDEFEIPRQTIASASVYYVQNELQGLKERGFNTVIHSHHNMNCSFSKDDDDTINTHFPCSVLYSINNNKVGVFKLATLSLFYNEIKFILEPKIEINRYTNITIDDNLLNERITKTKPVKKYTQSDESFNKTLNKSFNSDLQLIDVGNGLPLSVDDTTIQDALDFEELIVHIDSLVIDILEIAKNKDYESDYLEKNFSYDDFIKMYPYFAGIIKKPFCVIDSFEDVPINIIKEDEDDKLNVISCDKEKEIYDPLDEVYDEINGHEKIYEKYYQLQLAESTPNFLEF